MKINADLGEREPPECMRALMELIDFANIACGDHAGTAGTMRAAIRLAMEKGVRIGAHPGLAADFGRGAAGVTACGFRSFLAGRLGAFAALCREEGAELHHVKLHGALYHAVENSPELAEAYVEGMRADFPGAAIIAFAGGMVSGIARRKGMVALAEVFAERGYRADGSLIPRGEPGDLITDPEAVAARVPSLRGDTICVHADTPNAVSIARAVRRALG